MHWFIFQYINELSEASCFIKERGSVWPVALEDQSLGTITGDDFLLAESQGNAEHHMQKRGRMCVLLSVSPSLYLYSYSRLNPRSSVLNIIVELSFHIPNRINMCRSVL